MRKHLGKVHKIVLSGIIFLLIPVVLFLLITSRSSMIFGIRSYDVLTGSMDPAIPVGSMVFTSREKQYSIGEIITFNRGDIAITHRIVGMKNGQFVTRGDANKAADPELVSQLNVIGKDSVIIPYLGKITSVVKTVPGFILLIALPILLFIGFEINTIKKEFEIIVEKKVIEKVKAGETI